MTTIVIFTRTINPDGYPFNSEYYYEAYFDLLLSIKARGAEVYFATGDSYEGNGVFKEAFTADKKVRIAGFTRKTKVRADLVLEKGGFTGTDVMVINPPFVHKIASDKAETYKLFAKYQPKSVVCENLDQVKQALADMPGEMAAVKEPVSNRGMAVAIGTKKKVLAKLAGVYPIIVQEFIDTSIGIEGLVEGIHDIRVKIVGGKVIGGMVRTPALGEYRANLAQGGSARHLFAEEIPKAALEIAHEIDCYFDKYPRYYAIDLANTTSGWKLIELNSKPGFAPLSVSAAAKYATEQLADYLIAMSSKTR